MREITMHNFANTGPVINWLKLPESGERLLTLVSAINTPAVAAAFCVQPYTAKANNEISIQIGDLISVIDMPSPEESLWWRGKRGFEVGFFPSKCVEVISERAPILNLENLKNTLLRRKSLQRQQRQHNENENPFLSALHSTDIAAGNISPLSTGDITPNYHKSNLPLRPVINNADNTPISTRTSRSISCDSHFVNASPSAAEQTPSKRNKLSNFLRLIISRGNAELDSSGGQKRKLNIKTTDNLKKHSKSKNTKKCAKDSQNKSKEEDPFAFGCDLAKHLTQSGRDLPLVLSSCCNFLEHNGVIHGIYRLSGVSSNIQKLIKSFNNDIAPDFSDDLFLQDVHCVASLLKLYFRELPNPLLTYELYEHFVKAIHPNYPNESLSSANNIPEETKLANLIQALRLLPLPNYRTLEYLIKHLNKIASHSESTGMTIKNLAIVWAPNLLRSRELETQGGIGALQCIAIQAVLTEYLIRFVDRLFTEQSRPLFDCEHSTNCTTEDEPSTPVEPESLNGLQPLSEIQTPDKSTESVITNNIESPVPAYKCLDLSTSSTKLITLKEARTRWEKRKLLTLNTELANDSKSSFKEFSSPERNSLDSPNQVYFDRQHVMFRRMKLIEEPKNKQPEERISPRILRSHTNTEVNKTSNSNEEPDENSTFGVLGRFDSSRRRKRFGNLELSSPLSSTSPTGSDKQNFPFYRTENLKPSLDRLEGNQSSTDSLDIRSNHSEEAADNKKFATLEQFPTRYHTILNPKHFRKNPFKQEEESELDRVFKSRTNRIGKL